MVHHQTLTLKKIDIEGYEKVFVVSDETVSLKAIIAIHSTKLGPSLGGIRYYPYPNFDEALLDVLRLSKSMTYKAAASNLCIGGGKSVIIGNPKTEKTEDLLKSFGKAVNQLKGDYICAEDVGTTPQDMYVIHSETPFVTGLQHENSSGNPSPFTAWGTYKGIQATCQMIFQDNSVKNRRVVIQGLGSVGSCLLEQLFWHGADLIVTDLDREKGLKLARKFKAEYVDPQDIYDVECDIFSPCAMGGILNKDNIARLNCKGIAGAANNQLAHDSDIDFISDKEILYAPDFVINSGGLSNVWSELNKEGYNPSFCRHQADRIYDRLLEIYSLSQANHISSLEASIKICDQILNKSIDKNQKHFFFHHSNHCLTWPQL